MTIVVIKFSNKIMKFIGPESAVQATGRNQYGKNVSNLRKYYYLLLYIFEIKLNALL